MIRILRALAALTAVFAAAIVFAGRVDATTNQYTYKLLYVNVTVTPTPIAMIFGPRRAVRRPQAVVALARARYGDLRSVVVAQSSQSNVKVQITTNADPTGNYLHLSPNVVDLNAGYGTNTFTCAFNIFAYFAYAWNVTDWVYGSTAGVGGGTFPAFDNPTTPDIAWSVEGVSSGFTAYANGGSPGQSTLTGTKGSTKNDCVDLQLTVPASLPPGSYSTVIQYNLYVTVP